MASFKENQKLPPVADVLKLISHPNKCPLNNPIVRFFGNRLLDISPLYDADTYLVDCNVLNIFCPGNCPAESLGGVDVRVSTNSNQKSK